MERYPLVVIGAGPAGMAAASVAAEYDLEVLLLDDQASPGGQIYRNVSRASADLRSEILGREYYEGLTQVDEFLRSKINYSPASTVWDIDTERHVCYLRNNRSYQVSAEHLILACGSQERPMPFPGWDLPGVMMAGAAQILLKSQAMLPASEPVLAGSGPLLLLLAAQYLNAGLRVQGIVDTTPKSRYLESIRYLPGAMTAPRPLFKGLSLLKQIRNAGIPLYRGASNLLASGDSQVRQLSFHCAGKRHRIDTQIVLPHQGVVPQLQLVKLAGCELTYLHRQQSWSATVDKYGEGSVENTYIAGDGQQINGAELAVIAGKMSGLQVLRKLEKIDLSTFERRVKPLIKAKNKIEKARRFIDAIFRPSEELNTPSDDTMICRCEEITAGAVREIAKLGCQGPNQVKAFGRCGMGPCQGRFCESTVAALIAEVQDRCISEVGYYRVRPPIKPITLGQLGNAVIES
ncbi:MAG: (2Fe-2S)-binding protein [Acidiferrobacterales bacterium]|nr:(2Fe-2S)-binding protein [Acidiferrobacterales bacterium]